MARTLIGGLLVIFAMAASLGVAQGQAPRQLPLFPAAAFRGVPIPERHFYLALAVVEYGPGSIAWQAP